MTFQSFIPLALCAALLVSACGADQDAPKAQPGTPSAGAPSSGAPSAQQPPATAGGPAAPAAKPTAPSAVFKNIDTTDGTLTVTGSGVLTGRWTFKDVTATIEEHAVAGSTRSSLTLEAHDADQRRHIRLRLVRDGEHIDPGVYSIDHPSGNPPRRLDARFEFEGAIWLSMNHGSGSVELTSVDDLHATGSFHVLVRAYGKDTAALNLSGTFRQSVTH